MDRERVAGAAEVGGSGPHPHASKVGLHCGKDQACRAHRDSGHGGLSVRTCDRDKSTSTEPCFADDMECMSTRLKRLTVQSGTDLRVTNHALATIRDADDSAGERTLIGMLSDNARTVYVFRKATYARRSADALNKRT
jgi:hypothetical protein